MRSGALIPILLAVSLVLASAGDAPGPETRGEAAEAARHVPVHTDPAALEQAVLDATRALLREDTRSAREALDRVEAGCRRLTQDDAPAIPSDIISYDRALHVTIDTAREYAMRGKLDKTFEQFYWIQRSCFTCHDAARKAGILDERKAGAPKP